VSNYAVAEVQAVVPASAAMPSPAAKRMAAPMASPAMVQDKGRMDSGKKDSDRMDDLSGMGLGGLATKAKSEHAAAPEPRKSSLAKDEDAENKPREEATTRHCTVSATVEKAEHTSDPKALRALVEKAAHALGCRTAGTVKLRITLDGAGMITGVVLVSGDGAVARPLIQRLTGATSSTRAAGQNSGSVEMTVETK